LKIALQELKHSIKLHLSMAGGPSAELCTYTLKLIDFLDENPDSKEIADLSYFILRSIAINISDVIEKYANNDSKFSFAILKQGQVLKIKSDVDIENTKFDGVLSIKHDLLVEVAKALDMLKEHTKIEYPPIRDVSGKGL
jgi:hypothetical protein